ERKWLRMSGLVCLLPHGYEGQGPEHSSARLERYLQMCAEDNMQVANCTTPANYFHVLRRQLKRDIRKPLILMTPKSLLRHKRAVSRLDEMGPDTSFHRVLYDDAQLLEDHKIKLVTDDKIRRVILCSGKIYYDLYEEREKRGIDDIYIMRIEQLYPWPHKVLIQELNRFRQAEMVWCQEEPLNMGGWTFVQPNIERALEFIEARHRRPRYAGRPASAATATGLMSKHQKELRALIEEAAEAAAAPAAKSGTKPQRAEEPAKKADKADIDAKPLSPAVRKIVEENRIEAGAVAGTGKDGRLTKGDVLDHVARPVAKEAAPPPIVQAESRPATAR